MRLFNVRKGQFVYYKNELHKVYSVMPFFKQSIHLIRLRDLEQELSIAREINLYRPQHLDSFVYNDIRYTLRSDVSADVGDLILVIDPRPDSIDQHYLHAMETVTTIESTGVITSKGNGIKHNEYWVMKQGLLDEAQVVDYEDAEEAITEMSKEEIEAVIDDVGVEKLVDASVGEIDPQSPYPTNELPVIGDVFQKVSEDSFVSAMVVGIEDDTIYLGLGQGESVTMEDLTNPEKWTFLYHILNK